MVIIRKLPCHITLSAPVQPVAAGTSYSHKYGVGLDIGIGLVLDGYICAVNCENTTIDEATAITATTRAEEGRAARMF